MAVPAGDVCVGFLDVVDYAYGEIDAEVGRAEAVPVEVDDRLVEHEHAQVAETSAWVRAGIRAEIGDASTTDVNA